MVIHPLPRRLRAVDMDHPLRVLRLRADIRVVVDHRQVLRVLGQAVVALVMMLASMLVLMQQRMLVAMLHRMLISPAIIRAIAISPCACPIAKADTSIRRPTATVVKRYVFQCNQIATKLVTGLVGNNTDGIYCLLRICRYRIFDILAYRKRYWR